MPIDKIEVLITDLPQRLRRQLAGGTWDTGPAKRILGKPVFVKVFADGVVGHGQIRPFAPGHIAAADTSQSMLTAITELYGPALIGTDLFDVERHAGCFDKLLAQNRAARAVLDLSLHDAMGKALGVPVYKLLGGLCQHAIPL